MLAFVNIRYVRTLAPFSLSSSGCVMRGESSSSRQASSGAFARFAPNQSDGDAQFRDSLSRQGFTPAQIEKAAESRLYRKTGAMQFYWGNSPGHWNLLYRFYAQAGTVQRVTASYGGDWDKLLEEPLERAVAGLISAGLLRRSVDAKKILLACLSYRELQARCQKCGVSPSGRCSVLAERLVSADPCLVVNLPESASVLEVTEEGASCLARWYGW